MGRSSFYSTLTIVCSSFILDLDHGSFIFYIRPWSWVVHHLYSTLTIVCSSFIFDLDHGSFIINIQPRPWVVNSSFIFGYIHIQYWSVDGKYRIYLTRLRNGVKDELLASLSPRFEPSQINSIFTVNRPILYLSCNPRCPKKSF
jgi:hypothetical protein